jgi:hypothetical protein
LHRDDQCAVIDEGSGLAEMNEADPNVPPSADPGESRSRKVLYWLSVPERAVRGGLNLVGGALRETAGLLVPQSFQDSRSYTLMVRQMLDFLVEDIGRGPNRNVEAAESRDADFLARKTVGNFVEMSALATLHLSPLTLLAIVSDLAYGSKVYLEELGAELKRDGIIDESSTIHSASDLLCAVADTSSKTASVFNTPPLSVDGLRKTIEETRDSLKSINPRQILPEAEIRRLWNEMRQISDQEHVGLLQVSGAVTMQALNKAGIASQGALSGIRVARRLLDRHVLSHYGEAISRVRTVGFYQSLSETSGPYVSAVWENFSPKHSTLTEGVLSGKLLGTAWSSLQRLRKRDAKDDAAATDLTKDEP